MTNIFDKSASAYIHGLLTGVLYFLTTSIINEFWPNDFFINLSNFMIVIVWIIHLGISTLISYGIIRYIFKKKLLIFNIFSVMISVLLTSLLMTVYVYRELPLYNAYLAATLVIYQLFDILRDVKKVKK